MKFIILFVSLFSLAVLDYPLLPNVPVPNQSVSRFDYSYYYINLSAENSVGYSFKLKTNTGVAWLLVDVNKKPNITSAIYYQNDMDPMKQISPCRAIGGTFWIGIYGYQDATFTIEADIRADFKLNNMQVATGSLDGEALSYCMAYYTFDVPSGMNLLQFPLQTTKHANIYQYIRKDAVPTTVYYDFFNISTGVNGCLQIPHPRAGTWYYGLFIYTGTSTVSAFKTQFQLNTIEDCSFQL